MMNADMFQKWVNGRLMPTFEKLYGPGTDLGGADGKKMIVIMVRACQMHPSLLFNSLT